MEALEYSWFTDSKDECGVRQIDWNNAKEFEKTWLCGKVDPDDYNVTPWGSITLDYTGELGLISLEFGGGKIGYFTDFPGHSNYGSEGFYWKPGENLRSPLDILIKGKYPNEDDK